MFFVSFRYADPDLWGHIKFGEEIYTARAIPRYDHYSYIRPDLPWINHEWLSEVIFYLIYNLFGSSGLVIFKTIIGLIITFILWKTISLKVQYLWKTAPIPILLSASVLTFGFAIRPQIFTYLFFGVFLYLLYLFRHKNKDLLFILPLTMVFWVNLHGGFVAGIGMLGIFLAAEILSKLFNLQNSLEIKKLKKIAVIFIITIFATLINPYFFKLWLFLSTALTQNRPYIWEWLPPALNWIYVDYLILLILSSMAVLLLTKKYTLSELSLLLITMFLSAKHKRHIPFLGITAVLIIPLCFEHLFFKSRKSVIYAGRLTVIFLIAINSLLIFCEIFDNNPNSLQVQVNNTYPVRTVKFLKDNCFSGNILIDFDWGEYCIWKLCPNFKVSMDGRYETVYPADARNEYFDFLYGRENWQKFFDKYPHHWILINKNRPVVDLLRKRDDVIVLFCLKDSPAVLFIKKNSTAHKQLVQKEKTGELIYPDGKINNSDLIFP